MDIIRKAETTLERNMLEDEHQMSSDGSTQPPLTYAAYLRVPQLLSLQTLLSTPQAHDEMLFIVVQQVQELWFKQLLHELRAVVNQLDSGELGEAVRLLQRVNRILRTVSEEVALLQTMLPQEFQEFRHVLVTSSGFESEQFRELELASGLQDPTFLKLMSKHLDLETFQARWPRNLYNTYCDLLASVDPDPVRAIVRVYTNGGQYRQLFELSEALSEYEVLFSQWRFQHIKVVERTIGDRSPGTAGSSGAGYLGRTLSYRFFPELWEARNRMTAQASEPG
jgi:tryptophan 2,3-dioxygenase